MYLALNQSNRFVLHFFVIARQNMRLCHLPFQYWNLKLYALVYPLPKTASPVTSNFMITLIFWTIEVVGTSTTYLGGETTWWGQNMFVILARHVSVVASSCRQSSYSNIKIKRNITQVELDCDSRKAFERLSYPREESAVRPVSASDWCLFSI